MKKYGRLSGDSGVVAYQVKDEALLVRFVDGRVYTYSYDSPGREHVEQMKALAKTGKGLATYISKYVGANYASVS